MARLILTAGVIGGALTLAMALFMSLTDTPRIQTAEPGLYYSPK